MRNTSQFLYAHGDVEQAISYPCFTKTRPIDNKTISYGLNAIKNVGTKALETIIKERIDNGI